MYSRLLLIAAVVCGLVVCSNAGYKEDFGGKVAIVTGGSSGIGFATAMALARYGARVVIVARDSHPDWYNGADAAARINDDPVVQASGGSARFFKADCSNLTQMKALIEDIAANENDLTYAVNAAGITGPMNDDFVECAPFFKGPYDAIQNNIYGTLYSLIVELRFMTQKENAGSIVCLSSVNGLDALGGGDYGTSKWGIIGLTRSLGAAFAATSPIIRINSVAPTLVNTSLSWQQVKYFDDGKTQPWEGEYITPSHPLWQKYGPEWIGELIGKTIAEPEDIANGILYLLSSQSSFVTGMVLPIDRADSA